MSVVPITVIVLGAFSGLFANEVVKLNAKTNNETHVILKISYVPPSIKIYIVFAAISEKRLLLTLL